MVAAGARSWMCALLSACVLPFPELDQGAPPADPPADQTADTFRPPDGSPPADTANERDTRPPEAPVDTDLGPLKPSHITVLARFALDADGQPIPHRVQDAGGLHGPFGARLEVTATHDGNTLGNPWDDRACTFAYEVEPAAFADPELAAWLTDHGHAAGFVLREGSYTRVEPQDPWTLAPCTLDSSVYGADPVVGFLAGNGQGDGAVFVGLGGPVHSDMHSVVQQWINGATGLPPVEWWSGASYASPYPVPTYYTRQRTEGVHAAARRTELPHDGIVDARRPRIHLDPIPFDPAPGTLRGLYEIEPGFRFTF